MKKTRQADKRDGWYLVEPVDAQRLLDEQPANRPLRESKAIKFAESMASGRWRPNGEPIILDENDKLLDGQGRCRACAIAGKPLETYVIFGIPRKFFPSLDTGQMRGGQDIAAMLGGFYNYAVASAVAGLGIRCAAGSPTSYRAVPNDQIKDYLTRNRDRINRATEFVLTISKIGPIPISMVVYIYMEACEINPEKADKFTRQLLTGEGLSAGSPILVLRNRMHALRGETHTIRGFEKLALTIKAWNAFLSGRHVTLLKWTNRGGGAVKGIKRAEMFPVMGAEE